MLESSLYAVSAKQAATQLSGAHAYCEAERVLRDAIEFARRIDDRTGLRLLLLTLGSTLREQERGVDAVSPHLEALSLSRAAEASADEIGHIEATLAFNFVYIGVPDQAVEHADAAHGLLPHMASFDERIRAMNAIALTHTRLGYFASARTLYRQILAETRNRPDCAESVARERCRAFINLGVCCSDEALTLEPGSAQAHRLLRRQLRCNAAALHHCAWPSYAQTASLNSVDALIGLGRFDEAAALLERIAPAGRTSEKKELEAFAMNLRGQIAFGLGDYLAAASHLEKAVAATMKFSGREESARLLERLSRAAERCGDLFTALETERRAAELRKTTSRLLREARVKIIEARRELAVEHAAKETALRTVAGVLHDMRQPVTALMSLVSNAGILLDRGSTDAVRTTLARVGQMAQQMRRIVGQLTAFTRTGTVVRQSARLSEVLSHVLLHVEMSCREHRVQVCLDQPPEQLQVLADPVQLEQVLCNLLHNAIDAMEEAADKRIDVRIRRREQRVVIGVRDHGHGITPEAMQRLFEPFFTEKPDGKGSGLGLSISREVVRGFGGEISAMNEPDGGARFDVMLLSA